MIINIFFIILKSKQIKKLINKLFKLYFYYYNRIINHKMRIESIFWLNLYIIKKNV